MKLKGQVALITGSGRGIGKAIAILFAKEGAKIVLNHSKSQDEAELVMSEITKLGSEAISIECDVSNEDQVKAMIDQATKKFGGIDILINNAGIVHDVSFKDRTVDQWKETLGVNLIGTFLCSKYCAPYLVKNNGKIVNISSTNGINSFDPDSMDYDASKAGVIILTRDLAKQLAPGIRVNSIAPGWVNTKMNEDLPADFVNKETDKIYLKRFAHPDEIAKVALFLVSEDSGYITGSNIMVDGGYG